MCTDKVCLGLRQPQTEFGVFNDGERIALLHLLKLLEAYLADKALHATVLWHDVLANTGVVGKLAVPEVHELACRIGSSAQKANNDEGIV